MQQLRTGGEAGDVLYCVRLAYGGDFEIRNMNVVTPRGNQVGIFGLQSEKSISG